jgi:hypothetical protein
MTRLDRILAPGLALAVALGLVAAAGCASKSDDPEQRSADPPPTSSSQPSRSSGGDSGEILGTADGQQPTNPNDSTLVPLRIDLTSLERDGDLVVLKMTLHNQAAADAEPYAPYGTLGGGVGVGWDAGGAELVDGEGQKAYLSVYDTDDRCLCTDLSNVEIAPSESLDLYVTYGGVPEDLDAADVTVPGFPPIANVPIGG